MVGDIKGEVGRLMGSTKNAVSTPAATDNVILYDTSGNSTGYVSATNLSAIQEASEIATTLIARQNGGTAGTDEVQITHDGTNTLVTSKSGDINLYPGDDTDNGFTIFANGTVSTRGSLRVRQNGGVFGTDDVIIQHNGTDGIISSNSGEMFVQSSAGDQLGRYQDTAVSSAQILALNGTPITLVSAPGANKTIIVNKVVFFLDYNSAAYAGIAAGEDLAVRYTNGSGDIVSAVEATGFLDQTSDQYRVGLQASAAGTADSEVTPVVNAGVVLHMTTGNITTGDSPMGVRVFYDIVDLSSLSAT